MAGGLVRVAVLLCAVAAVTRATWHSHGKPQGTWIQTALAPLTQFEGKKWFGVSSNGHLYERYQDTSGTWHWVYHGKPSGSDRYNSEPCAFEGLDKLHLTAGDGFLYERYWGWGSTWFTANHGTIFNYRSIDASGCSSVKKPGLKPRTFMRGAVGQGGDGYLFERFWEWSTAAWTWRSHGRPVTLWGSTYVAYIKTTSYILSSNGISFVFVVGTDGNMYRRVTHQDGWGWWTYLGKPAGKTIRHIHATKWGGWWAITTDGSVCRFQGGWPCFSPPNRFVRDCSDPFYIGNGRSSMFCITDDVLGPWTSENRLYLLTVPGFGWPWPDPADWNDLGIPASNQYYYVDRPNVAFVGTRPWPVVQFPKSVFVPSTEGVYEWRW